MSSGLRYPHARHPFSYALVLPSSCTPRFLAPSPSPSLPPLLPPHLFPATPVLCTSWLKRVAPHTGLACHRFLPHPLCLRLTVSLGVSACRPLRPGATLPDGFALAHYTVQGIRPRPQGVSTVSGLYSTICLSPILVTPIKARRVSSPFQRFVPWLPLIITNTDRQQSFSYHSFNQDQLNHTHTLSHPSILPPGSGSFSY
jgi:hypothetical protein